MNSILKVANTLRFNLFCFIAAFTFAASSLSLNSCVQTNDNETQPNQVSSGTSPSINTGAKGALSSPPSNCEGLNMIATTVLTAPGSTVMQEKLIFTALPADHYVVEARTANGTLLYTYSGLNTIHSFNRTINFQPITWTVRVYSTAQIMSFQCIKTSKLNGGGISVIVVERTTTVGKTFYPYCSTLKPLDNFYTDNVINSLALETGNTPVPCYTYPLGQIYPTNNTEAAFIAAVKAKYSSNVNINIFVAPTVDECSFSPMSSNGANYNYTFKPLTTSIMIPATTATIATLNTQINAALNSAYPNYLNSLSMKKYTIAFVDLN